MLTAFGGPSFGEPSIAALRTSTMRPSRRSNSTCTAEPTTSSGVDAVELLADRADELDAAAGDDEDAEPARAQQLHQLEHRRVGQLPERHAEARMLRRGEPGLGVARELLRGPARVELEQHAGDRLHAVLLRAREVAGEQRLDHGLLGQLGSRRDRVARRAKTNSACM